MAKSNLEKKWWLMTDRIAEITGNPVVQKYANCNQVWHWFEYRKCGKRSQEQFEIFLINNFDGLQVIQLLDLYKEYEGWSNG